MRNALPRSLLLIAFASPLALAADVSPGSWEITMETRVPADPGFAPPPFQITRCLTAEDARDPSKMLGGVSNPGATGCSYTNTSTSGNLTQTVNRANTTGATKSRRADAFHSPPTACKA